MNFILLILVLSNLTYAEKCVKDSDCSSLSHCVDKECDHKSLFPLAGIEYVGTIMTILVSALSNAAGIGGGPLNTMTFQFFFLFGTFDSIPLSQIVIFGGSLMSVALKIPSRHPTKDRPLIDYELVAYLLTPLLAGTTIGVIFHLSFPDWLTILLLSILMSYLTYQTTKKGARLFHRETIIKNSSHSIARLIDAFQNDIRTPHTDKTDVQIERDRQVLDKIIEEENKLIPLHPAVTIAMILGVVLVAAFIKGGNGFESILGLSQCGVGYWIFIFFYFVGLMFLTYHNGKYIIEKTALMINIGYIFDPSDVKWNKYKAIKIGAVTFFAGVASGALGIGGGSIMNPFLLSIGVRPEVSTACSTFMVLFSSSIGVLQFMIGGVISFDYGAWSFVWAVVGSALGYFVIKRIIEKMNRPSIIVLLLAFMMIASLVGSLVIGIFKISSKISDGTMEYGFSSLC